MGRWIRLYPLGFNDGDNTGKPCTKWNYLFDYSSYLRMRKERANNILLPNEDRHCSQWMALMV